MLGGRRPAALDLAEAMADLNDTIADIDIDDFANIGGALQRSPRRR